MNKIKDFFIELGSWIKSLFVSTDDKEAKLITFYKKPGTKSFMASLISILVGIVVGFVVMIFLSLTDPTVGIGNAFSGLGYLLAGPFASPNPLRGFGDMVFYATPLIMCGLSVAIAFKTGLFNIGAPGQFLMGTMGSLLVALNIDCTGNAFLGFLVWLLAICVGMVLGAIWGAIPGIFKSLLGVNEVIVCIMTNWIAANVVSWVFSGTTNLINTGHGKSGYLITTAATGTGTPSLGLGNLFSNSYLDIGIFIAIAIAIVVYIIMNKTTIGYELKACGYNRNAAKYAGMNEKRNIIMSMAIAGGLAAIGGALYYLNPGIEFKFSSAYSKLPDYGFNGIPTALLATSNPIGTIFAAIFIRYIAMGGDNLVMAGFNRYISDIIIALIIYFAGFSKLITDLLVKRQKARDEKKLEQANANATIESKKEE